MLSTILRWIAGPFIDKLAGPALEAYRAKLAAGNDSDRIASELAGRELAVAQRELEVRSAERMAMKPWHPMMLMGYALAAYVIKVVVWDSMLGLGETPAVRGIVGEWLGIILNFYVGGSIAQASINSVAAIIKGRR